MIQWTCSNERKLMLWRKTIVYKETKQNYYTRIWCYRKVLCFFLSYCYFYHILYLSYTLYKWNIIYVYSWSRAVLSLQRRFPHVLRAGKDVAVALGGDRIVRLDAGLLTADPTPAQQRRTRLVALAHARGGNRTATALRGRQSINRRRLSHAVSEKRGKQTAQKISICGGNVMACELEINLIIQSRLTLEN